MSTTLQMKPRKQVEVRVSAQVVPVGQPDRLSVVVSEVLEAAPWRCALRGLPFR